MKNTNIDYTALAGFLCGEDTPETKAAHEAYCEAYDEAHKEDNQTA